MPGRPLPDERLLVRGEVVERVTGFVHERVDVVRDADGVHEDERLPAEAELRAVATRRFPLPTLEIQQPLGRHQVELVTELRIHPAKYRLRAIDERRHVLERTERLDALELDAEVPGPNAVEPEALLAIRELPSDDRYDGALHG